MYSEHGEDIFIQEWFKKHPPENKFLVDVGCADGVRSSNTKLLLEDNWGGLLMDDNRILALDAKTALGGYDNVKVIRSFITPTNLDELLELYQVPKRFGFLSIDTDSYEYEIWKNTKYRPEIVCIEINQFELNLDVIDYDPSYSLWKYGGQRVGYGGATLGLMNKLAEEKGYRFIKVMVSNAIYIDKEVYGSDAAMVLDTRN